MMVTLKNSFLAVAIVLAIVAAAENKVDDTVSKTHRQKLFYENNYIADTIWAFDFIVGYRPGFRKLGPTRILEANFPLLSLWRGL